MTWKSYAAVSGATVMAGWLASTPPANAPAPAVSSQAATGRATAAPDIEREAMRLQARVRREAVYVKPHRNLFRFGPAQPMVAPAVGVPETATRAETIVPAAPAPPLVSLSGIAEDPVDGRVERTAILSSPDGVLLVREGDDVLGQYRVARVEGEAVDLVKLVDGTTLRLVLTP